MYRQINCYIYLHKVFFYLVRSWDTTEMVQSITAPMELVQLPDVNEILFSGSESKWYIDPLEPLCAPYCTILPGLQECSRPFLL